MRIVCFFLLFFLPIISCYGQGSATGCLIPGEQIVYPDGALKVLSNGNSIYYETNPKSLDANYCYWTPPSTANSCTVCTGLGLCIANVCLCIGAQKDGYTGTFTMVECNLDDHSWLFGAAAGLFGILIIRKRIKP